MAKGGAGRKQLWDELDIPSKLNSIKGWCLQGSTDIEIMEMLGISKDTYYKWKREKSEFKEAIKRGKDIANGELINSAFKQAHGYYVQVTEPMKMKDEHGADYIEMVTYDKFIPANNTMAIFMLKNRIPEHYKDKHDVNVSGNMNLTFIDDLESDDNED